MTMRPFDYYRVSTIEQGVAVLEKYQEKAALLAGGSDLLGLMKDAVGSPAMQVPQHLVDVRNIRGLATIQEKPSGLRIGAAVTLAKLASSPLIAEQYQLVSEAARQVAVPQIRNVATVGGNLCQRPRCWYYRGKLFTECLRKGGGTCYAQEPTAENQDHAILQNAPCGMVCPSDLAPALVALDAQVEIAGAKGRRFVALEKFYLSPENSFTQETVLSKGEMLLAVEIPAAARGRKGVYLKVRERQAFDFAQVSLALSVTLNGRQVKDARVVFGGLAAFPLRSRNAEAALKGKELGKDIAKEVFAVSLPAATPLSKNAYKLSMARGAMEQALMLI